jgi:hypothetical protein
MFATWLLVISIPMSLVSSRRRMSRGIIVLVQVAVKRFGAYFAAPLMFQFVLQIVYNECSGDGRNRPAAWHRKECLPMHPHSTQLPLPLETEEWRPVVGHEGWYEVSNLGRIRRTTPGPGTYPGRILKTGAGGTGYQPVRVEHEGKWTSGPVHRLVALAFLPPTTSERTEVDHKDGNKQNNRPDNLEWVTHGENMRRWGERKRLARLHCGDAGS